VQHDRIGNFQNVRKFPFCSDGGTVSETRKEQKSSDDKATVTLTGTVDKIIPPILPGKPEKAQISVNVADELYREIRVENTLEDADGKKVSLKKGAEVEVTIEADPNATKPQTS
jgi:hypothetical protein